MVSAEQLSAFRCCVDDIFGSLGKFLADLTDAPSREVGDAQTSMDEQLQHFFNVYYALRKRHDEASLSAAILALTKSGKSTLLNAIMGRECLPMNNVPETARLCKIEHAAVEQPRMVERGVEYHGDAEIRRRLQEVNSEVRAREYQPSDEHMLHIFTPVAVFNGKNDSGTKFFLLDTPGPNEAGEEGLRFQVERLLDTVDAVIYLLDYTKLKTAEEAAIFSRLKQINPLLVRRLSQRLFFVVNKADQLHESEGLDEHDTKEYVAQLVTQQLAFEGFQLTPDQVILLSARNALSARLVLGGQTPKETFYHLAFGTRWKKRLPSLTRTDIAEAASEMLEDSGIQELEERVLGFLYNHSASLKILAVVDDVARLLQEVWNVTESCRAALAKTVVELQARTQEMRLQLQDTLRDFEGTIQTAETLQSHVTDEIRQHLDNLRTKLFNYIMQTLEPEIQGAASPVAGRSQPSRWKSIRDKFLGLFGAGRSASRSKDELASLLCELHEDLLAQINSEVSEFWHVLEGCTSLRHAQLITSINQQLKTLSSRVEHIVSETLDVELEAVHISLQMPSAEQFHSDLQDLITRGIAEKTERHIRVGQRKYEERVMRFRQGLCRLGTYWENVPRTRTVVETYNVTVFQVQPSEILNHFIHMVDSAVDNTSAVLHSYVRQFMQDQLTAARDKIKAYADRYMQAMSSALDTSSAGEAARQVALAQAASRLSQVEELRGAVSELQNTVEALVPRHDYEEVDFELYEMLLEQQRELEMKEVEAARAALEAAGLDNVLASLPSTSSSISTEQTELSSTADVSVARGDSGAFPVESVAVPNAGSIVTAIQAELSPMQLLESLPPLPSDDEDTGLPDATEPAPKSAALSAAAVPDSAPMPADLVPIPADSAPVSADSAPMPAGPASIPADSAPMRADSAPTIAGAVDRAEPASMTGGVAESEVPAWDADSAMSQVGSVSERDVDFDDGDSVVVVTSDVVEEMNNEGAGGNKGVKAEAIAEDAGTAAEEVEDASTPEELDAKMEALEATAEEHLKASIGTEPEAKVEAEMQVEVAAEMQAEVGAEMQAEVKAEMQAEAEAEMQAEVKAEPEAEVKAEPEAALETKPETEVMAEPEATALAKLEVKAELEAEPGTEVQPKTVVLQAAVVEGGAKQEDGGEEEDALLFVDAPQEEAEEQLLEEQQLIPELGPDGEVLAHAESGLTEQVSEPTTPHPFLPVVEVAADYANLPSPPSPHLPTSSLPQSSNIPTSPKNKPHSHFPSAEPHLGLPVVEASRVVSEGYRTCSEEDTDYDSVQKDDVPFDYNRGFFAAMSTSQVAQAESPMSHSSEDGWEVVDEAHVDAKPQ